MKRLLLLISLAMTFILTGCSPSVPDCGNEKTTSTVKGLALQNLLGDEAKNLSDMFKVEISAVQIVAHSKDPEKYSCKANVNITASGKIGELYGNINDEVTRMLKGKLTADETGKLGKYLALQSAGDFPGVDFTGPEITPENMVVLSRYFFKGEFYLDDLLKIGFDPAKRSAAQTAIIMLKLSTAMHRLSEPKTIEFTSTSAQQDGAALHYVEIQRLWPAPDLLLVEVAKFSKVYVPSTPAKTTQPSLLTTPVLAVEASAPILAVDTSASDSPASEAPQSSVTQASPDQ